MKEQAQFIKDLDKTIDFNGNPMPLGYYNLVVSIRDFKMYARHGMKPHRGWQPTAAKQYFGIKKNENAKNVVILLEGWRDMLIIKEEL